MPRLCGFIALALVVLLISAADTQAEAPDGGTTAITIDQIDIGIAGHFKVGCLTPISVTFSGTVDAPVQLAVWVPNPDGNPTKQPSDPVEISGDGPHQLTSVFRTGRMDGVVRVEVETDGRVLASRVVRSANPQENPAPTLFPPDSLSEEYWLTLGTGNGYERAAAEINERARESQSQRRDAVTVIPLDEASTLPTQPGGLDSVDVVAINGAHPIPDATAAALRSWVEQGGHLILSVSSQEEWKQLPFSEWVPIRDVGNSRLRDLDGIRGQFPRSEVFKATTVKALRFSYDAGDVLASSLDGPLWVRLPVQFGRVSLLGLDLTVRPLNTWDSLAPLCARLADYQKDLGSKQEGRQTAQLSRTGVSDLSTQLATSIDQFPQIETSSSWAPMGLIILYLLIIGPLDYLIVHRLLRRPQLTWVTFPIMVIASAALAASSAQQNHPSGLTAREVSLVDFDASSGAVRTKLWTSFVSPETRRYKVDAKFPKWWQPSDMSDDESSRAATRLGWTGIPENSFRGMYRSGGLDLPKPRYRFADGLSAIENIPVNIWSSAGTTGDHFGYAKEADRILRSDLEGVGGQLYGTITNELPIPIDDWFLVYENLVYFPRPSDEGTAGPLAAGSTISVRQNRMVVRTARSYLTGVTNIRVKKGEGLTDQSDAATRTSYDPLGRDFDQIFRAISFFQASGGKEFTTIDNDAIARLDLSPLLDLSRAVLFGRINATPAQLVIDDQPVEPAESEAFIRVLFPVRPRD